MDLPEEKSVSCIIRLIEFFPLPGERLNPVPSATEIILPPVEPTTTSSVLEVASLVLYGTSAIPVRLKILLDRLLSALPNGNPRQVLDAFGWTYDEYLRGYVDQVGFVVTKYLDLKLRRYSH